jgi:hypothetical protein
MVRFTERRNDHHHSRDEAAEELALACMALVLGFSLIGLTVSLALVATSWPDGPVPWF